MDDSQFEALTEALQKMGDLQIKTLIKVTRLQAQVMVLGAQVRALQASGGGDPEEIVKQTAALFKEYDDALVKNVQTWMAERDIALPVADDPWWDQPPDEKS